MGMTLTGGCRTGSGPRWRLTALCRRGPDPHGTSALNSAKAIPATRSRLYNGAASSSPVRPTFGVQQGPHRAAQPAGGTVGTSLAPPPLPALPKTENRRDPPPSSPPGASAAPASAGH